MRVIGPRQFDEWLSSIAQHVFSVVPFQLGLVGIEVCAQVDAAQISKEGVPAERHDGYLVPCDGELKWYPPNVW